MHGHLWDIFLSHLFQPSLRNPAFEPTKLRHGKGNRSMASEATAIKGLRFQLLKDWRFVDQNPCETDALLKILRWKKPVVESSLVFAGQPKILR